MRAVSRPDIYEFDYKGFFDNLNAMKVITLLKRLGLPGDPWCRKLRVIARSLPTLPESDPPGQRDPIRDVITGPDGQRSAHASSIAPLTRD